jgi:hypothetical protein
MKKVTTTEGIQDAYIKRILGNIIGVDPMSVLKTTPKRLVKATKGLTKKQMQTPWAPGKWNMIQIVSHLCDAELAMGYRFRKVVAEPGSPLQAYDENKWTANLHYEESDPHAKVEFFNALRAQHVWLLSRLNEEEIQRWGLHEERGQESVERMAHMLAGHDINHIRQLETIHGLVTKKKSAKKKPTKKTAGKPAPKRRKK